MYCMRKIKRPRHIQKLRSQELGGEESQSTAHLKALYNMHILSG